MKQLRLSCRCWKRAMQWNENPINENIDGTETWLWKNNIITSEAEGRASSTENKGKSWVWATGRPAGRGHAFERLISLEPKARLTSGLLWWASLLPCMGPMPNHANTHCGTWRVLPGPNLTNMSPRPHVPISALWCPHVPIGCPYGHFRCVGGGPMPVSNSRMRRFRLAHR